MRKLKGILSAVMAVIMVISGTGFYGTDVTLAAEAESNVVYTDSDAFEFDYGSGTITGYTGSDTDVVIPERIDGVKVEVIADNAFRSSNITSVVIPEGVTSIGSYAFGYCSSLKSATIPGSVKDWYSAFSNCAGLESVEIKEGITNIGGSAFQNCTALTSVTIPEGVTSIGSYAFSGCSLLSSITIPEGVTNIGSYAFGDCGKLTSVTIPGSVEDWDYAFYDCTGLEIADIKEGVTDIGSNTFQNCTALTSVTIPESVKSIGDYALYGCSGLKSIIIPDSVTDIGNYSFYNCVNLNSVVIGSGMDSIGANAFAGCIRLENVEIEAAVRNIGIYAFRNCMSLKEIRLTNGTKGIDRTAFSNTGIERVYCYSGGAADNEWLYPDGVEFIYCGEDEWVSNIFRGKFYIPATDAEAGVTVVDNESVMIVTEQKMNYVLRNTEIVNGKQYTSYAQTTSVNTKLTSDSKTTGSYRLAYRITAKEDTIIHIDHKVAGNKSNYILKNVEITGVDSAGTTAIGTAEIADSLVNNSGSPLYGTFTEELKAGESIWVAGLETNICIYAIYTDDSSISGEIVTETTTEATPEPGSTVDSFNADNLPVQTLNTDTYVENNKFLLLATTGAVSVDANSKIFPSGESYTQRFKLGGTAVTAAGETLPSARAIVFESTGSGTLTVDLLSSTSSEVRQLDMVDAVTGEVVSSIAAYGSVKDIPSVQVMTIPAAGIYYLASNQTIGGGVNIYGMYSDVALVEYPILPSSGDAEASTETTTEVTTEVTTEAVSGFSIYGDIVTASNGSAELTFRINNNPGIANYTVFVTYDADVLMAKSGTAGYFDSNGDAVNNQINYVPEAGDSDYDGADGVKTAAQLGKIKITGLSDTNVTTANAVAFTIDFDVLTTFAGKYPVNVYIVSAGNDTSDILLSNCEGYAGYVVVETTEQTTETTTSATVVEPGEAANFELWLDDMAVDGTVATKAYTGDVALTTGETVSLGDSILEL